MTKDILIISRLTEDQKKQLKNKYIGLNRQTHWNENDLNDHLKSALKNCSIEDKLEILYNLGYIE